MSNPLFDYEAISRRDPLQLPEGKTIAVWVGCNVEHYEWGKPALSLVPAFEQFVPDPINYGWRDFGARVGFWRLAEMFEELGITVTTMLNSSVAEHYPPIVEEIKRLNWSVVGHGRDNSTLQVFLEPDVERAYIREVTEELEQAIGRRPRGWLGPARSSSLATNDILAANGYTHALDWGNDDQPYLYRVKSGRLASIPYSIEVNDILVYAIQGAGGPEFERRIRDQFDTLRSEGARSARVMGISVHPFLSGQAFRVGYLRRALQHIVEHDDVWITTSDEIADWYLGQLDARN